MSDRASISIIIPTRNRPEFLKEAVDSVLNQTLTADEIIIVDDGSDRKYVEEIEWITKVDSSINMHRFEIQKGVSHCRNFGIERSTGKHILFLDDDDTLNPNMLEKSIAAIEDVDIVSCRTHVFCEHDVNAKRIKAYNWQEQAVLDMYKMEGLPTEHIFLYHPMIHSFLFRRHIFDEVRFPEELVYGEDFYVWFLLAASEFKFKKVDFVGGNCRMHLSNASSKVDVHSKLKFYSKVLNELTLSPEVKNLTHIKLTMALLKSGRLSFLRYLFKALSKPILFIKHSKHFLSVYY